MAQVIDSLILELGLDPKNFTREQQEAVERFKRTRDEFKRTGEDVEDRGRRLEETFATLKRGAVGMLTAFLGGRGIVQFTQHMTNLDAATTRVSKVLNMSARELSAWQGAAEQTGGSAEAMTSALGGLSKSMNESIITGVGPFRQLFNNLGIDINEVGGRLKTVGDVMLEIADKVHERYANNPAQANAILGLIPGMNQDAINLLIQGRKAVEDYLRAARAAGGTTEESGREALKYQRDLALLNRTAEDTGRTLLTVLMPSLQAVLEKIRSLLNQGKSGGMRGWLDSFLQVLEPNIKPGSWIEKEAWWWLQALTFTPMSKDQAGDALRSGRGSVPGTSGGSGAPKSDAEAEAIIRREAIARRIDPDQAVRVWTSEGRHGYVGDRGSSFGPFQLHYGGVAGGGMAVSGLGDKFTKTTGLDARDPNTFTEQVRFSLDEAARSGWGPWHGWRGLPRAGLANAVPLGGAAVTQSGATTSAPQGTTTTVNIQTQNIVTQATDAQGIARTIKPAMERASFAASANGGAN